MAGQAPQSPETGFDIVIGNPPYVDYRKIDTTITTNNNLPINFNSKRPNLYQFFIERGDQLLNENGILCFINPNQFLSTNSGFGLRKHLIEKKNILFIVDVSYVKVFDGAATYPIVYAFNKKGERKIRVNRCLDLNKLEETTFFLLQDDLIKSSNKIIPTNPTFFILSKIENNCSLKLKDIAKLKWGTSATIWKIENQERQF
ncbi:MAG: Eco57I restriction-modification methylase domain-containing protein [Dysgonamonadaceae bacterium]|nr:Eco57I restriction-modification methylase domain-containing protein [Dysgonamonadaceae bacterium]